MMRGNHLKRLTWAALGGWPSAEGDEPEAHPNRLFAKQFTKTDLLRETCIIAHVVIRSFHFTLSQS
jgi:hypothetical protein